MLLILGFGLKFVRAYVCTYVFMYVTYGRAGWRSVEAPYCYKGCPSHIHFEYHLYHGLPSGMSE